MELVSMACPSVVRGRIIIIIQIPKKMGENPQRLLIPIAEHLI
jgi:hypothetical protein